MLKRQRSVGANSYTLLVGIGDPINAWLVKEGAKSRSEQYKKKCEHCGADFKIEEPTNPAKYPVVHVTRFLGIGESADEPIWLAQCNVQAWSRNSMRNKTLGLLGGINARLNRSHHQ